MTGRDRGIVRELAMKVAEIAALPVQEEKRRLWRRLNALDPVRPMVWIYEIPWQELEREDELACRCEDGFARLVERDLRETLYNWNHMRTDMVVDGVYRTPLHYHDTGFGIEWHRARSTTQYGMDAAAFVPILRDHGDLEMIRTPVVTPDPAATESDYANARELLGDALPVEKRGVCHMWFAPWDILVGCWGVGELYADMVERPDFVHAGIDRLVKAHLGLLDQLERHGLLSVSDGNHRVGSGGFGFTDELPQKDFDGVRVRTMDQWGMATGQVMAGVSPAMHDEFCLSYELKWLERFGLNSYGCCEPLDRKIGMLRKVPRLRRVSMSRWVDIDRGAEALGRSAVYSARPSPGVFAQARWDPDEARRELRNILEKTRRCAVELIMTDVITFRSDPRRLEDWCRLAMEEAGG